MNIQDVYTLAELGAALGISKYRVQTMLRHAKIVPVRSGNKYVVFMSQIRAAMPEMWDTLNLNGTFSALHDDDS